MDKEGANDPKEADVKQNICPWTSITRGLACLYAQRSNSAQETFQKNFEDHSRAYTFYLLPFIWSEMYVN